MSGVLNLFAANTTRVQVTIVIGSPVTNYVLNTSKVIGYAAGLTDVTLVVNELISSSSTALYALTVDTSWNSKDTVTIVNNNYIIGMGGAGGVGDAQYLGYYYSGTAGYAGGPAVSVGRTTTFTNNGTVGGGGGGGGGGESCLENDGGSLILITAGGGGGGKSGSSNSAGGAAGSAPFYYVSGSPGASGTFSTAGSGGAPGSQGGSIAGQGGSGGGWGSAGATGLNADGYINSGTVYAGGAAGACLVGKSFVNGGAGISGVAYGSQT